MRIAIIHSGNSGFFPRFYKALYSVIETNGDTCRLYVPNSGRNHRCILPGQHIFGNRLNWLIHSRLFRITGIRDIFSVLSTLNIIHKLNKYKPNLIHCNLINDDFLNIPLFVYYINKHNIPIIWTMHDCRAFTGGCPYFDEVKCNKWKTGCGKCPQKETIIDGTHLQWIIRKYWNNKINKLQIVVPSNWLANFVKESFLKEHPIQVIYNGVDISIFSNETNIDIRKKYHIDSSKKIILGCAIHWENRKGLKFFKQMAPKLNSEYQIVLIGGISKEIQENLKREGIICTGKTSTIEEMVAWYQSASVFVNPTLADNFPTTNIEALASGTPVITFNTGGSPEAIDNKTGIVVAKEDLNGLISAIEQINKTPTNYTKKNCLDRAEHFSQKQYLEYYKLYLKIINHE